MNNFTEMLLANLSDKLKSFAALAPYDVLSLARPSVRLSATRVPYARLEIGASRFGGIPDVPTEFEWPRWKPAMPTQNKYAEHWNPDKPMPLGFIAQIDLSEMPQIDNCLPSTGWLYFFYDRYCERWGYDPADRGCCRVIYFNGDRQSLTRADPPLDADAEHLAEPCLIEAWPELTLTEDTPFLEYGTSEFESYQKLSEELTKAGGNIHHRLLGHPQLIQNPMELECQLASNGIYCGSPEGYESEQRKSLEGGAVDWRLLLQIDTDEDGPGWMWGDVGRIYFWVKQQELATLNFDNAWLVFQCC